jgi:outer membrane protein assembly complex protein YaeT
MKRGIVGGLLALTLSLSAAFAQTTAYEGRTITKIEFAPLQPLDPADLARTVPLKEGSALHEADVARSIDGLFASGRFEDIVVEAEASGNGVLIRFNTKLAWFVGHVEIKGKLVSPPSSAQISASDQFSLGTPFHDQDVKTATESITKLLTANGLYHAEVSSDVERNEQTQEVYVTFRVKEHKRAKYAMPVIKGNPGLSEATILRATGWRFPIIHLWRQVTDAKTQGGVHGLLTKYANQNRLTAKVDLDKLDYDDAKNWVHPNLTVNPGPVVKVEAVETKVSHRVLKRYVPIFEEGSVDNDLLVEGRRNLEDYFQSQGYYDASVDFRIGPPEKDLEKIEYVISRGSRYKLVKVTIDGNHYFPESAIRERLFMQPAAFTLRHGRYSEAFRRKDEQNIKDLYQSNGFRDVKVSTAVSRDYQGKQGDVAVTVAIDEGQQWIVDSLLIDGTVQLRASEFSGGLTASAGQPFADVSLAQDRNYVLTFYAQRGFPSATFKAAWRPSEKPHHVDVVYTIDEGSRQYVRDVLITGLRTTRRGLVDRTLRIDPGDPLSPATELEAQQRLYNLGVFARVDTAIEDPDGDIDHKYVLYSFDEANRYRVGVGIGAQVANFGTPSTTSLASPGGTTGFSPQFSLDVSRINFLGLGHTVSFRGGYSSIERRASISYQQPRLHNIQGLDVTYNILYDDSLNVRTFASRREEASVQVSDKLSKSLTAILRFAYRRVSVSSIVIPDLLVPQLLQPVRIGILSMNIAQDRRDHPDNPQRGMYNTGEVGVAGSFFGSQRNFARILLRNATYYHLFGQWVLARQTQFGVIQPFSVGADISDAEAVPLPERFFGGGADSLRAFSYNQAGPRDIGAALAPGSPTSQPTGFPLGGNALFFNNVELRFPLMGQNVQGVFFYDAGNVYSSLSNMSFHFHQRDLQDFDYMVHAPGFGIRYRTPIGPIRVDFAYSINPPSYLGFSGTPDQLLQCNPNLPPSQLPSYCQSSKQTLSHFQFFFSIGQTF